MRGDHEPQLISPPLEAKEPIVLDREDSVPGEASSDADTRTSGARAAGPAGVFIYSATSSTGASGTQFRVVRKGGWAAGLAVAAAVAVAAVLGVAILGGLALAFITFWLVRSLLTILGLLSPSARRGH